MRFNKAFVSRFYFKRHGLAPSVRATTPCIYVQTD